MSVGYDHIDLAACKNSNVIVGNTPGVLTDTTADLAVSLLLATSRRIPEGISSVKKGTWPLWKPEWLLGKDVSNSTVGIIGFGRIGQAFAKRMNKGFNCKILYTGFSGRKEDVEKETNAKYVDLDTLLKESDFVSAHCGLSEKTKHFFNKDFFKKMKNDAIFINTTRGDCVNQDDLFDALKNQEILAAGLDVTTPEPISKDYKLVKLDNCVILPHLGSATRNCRDDMGILAAKNVIAYFNNEDIPAKVEL
eukprot:gene5378-9185_t